MSYNSGGGGAEKDGEAGKETDRETGKETDREADGEKENSRREEVEARLNLVLLKIAQIQDRVWDLLGDLDEKGRLSIELEEHARKVMKEVSIWVDQCSAPAESPPVLQRRMEVQLQRMEKLQRLLEDAA